MSLEKETGKIKLIEGISKEFFTREIEENYPLTIKKESYYLPFPPISREVIGRVEDVEFKKDGLYGNLIFKSEELYNKYKTNNVYTLGIRGKRFFLSHFFLTPFEGRNIESHARKESVKSSAFPINYLVSHRLTSSFKEEFNDIWQKAWK